MTHICLTLFDSLNNSYCNHRFMKKCYASADKSKSWSKFLQLLRSHNSMGLLPLFMFQCSKHHLAAFLVGYGRVYAGISWWEWTLLPKVQPGGHILVAQLLQHGTTKWFIESLRSTNENHHIICRWWPQLLYDSIWINMEMLGRHHVPLRQNTSHNQNPKTEKH